MNPRPRLAPVAAIMILAAGASLAADATNATRPQVRRAAYQEIALRLRQGDVAAGKAFDAVLSEFET